MCDWATQQLVEQVVQDRCRRAEMFTALDISLEVKRQGSRQRHRHMKTVVHRCFERGDMGPGIRRGC